MGLFRKGKTRIIAKFHRPGLVICSHSSEGKTLSYRQINMVNIESEMQNIAVISNQTVPKGQFSQDVNSTVCLYTPTHTLYAWGLKR